jgi:hypothetical protein
MGFGRTLAVGLMVVWGLGMERPVLGAQTPDLQVSVRILPQEKELVCLSSQPPDAPHTLLMYVSTLERDFIRYCVVPPEHLIHLSSGGLVVINFFDKTYEDIRYIDVDIVSGLYGLAITTNVTFDDAYAKSSAVATFVVGLGN